MRAGELAFIGALVHAHRWFLGLLQEHLDFYDGLLPHLLLADVERWAEAALADGSEGSLQRLAAVLAFLEQGMLGGAEAKELISVSFLEHLPRPGVPGSELRSLVGPACIAQLSIIG